MKAQRPGAHVTANSGRQRAIKPLADLLNQGERALLSGVGDAEGDDEPELHNQGRFVVEGAR